MHSEEVVQTNIQKNISSLHPVYFAAVMATGIISINTHLLGYSATAWVLFLINLVLYFGLVALSMIRITGYTSSFLMDCSDHQRSPGFFTIVAATSIIGTQAYLIAGSVMLAQIFFALAVILWLIAIYSIFVLLTIKPDKPPFEKSIHGGWLVSIVSTQSIPVVGSIFLDPSKNNETMLFILSTFWLFGGMLYIWIISIIFYRYMFFKFDPTDLMPPYWINMGAMAISSLAGSLIVLKSPESELLRPLLPFFKGLTLMYWATATWWIPMLLILGLWRHLFRKVKITYSPLFWGLVFPIGMYSACTIRLTQIMGAPLWLEFIAKVFAAIGLLVWLLAFSGMLRRIFHIIGLDLKQKNLGKS